MRKRFLIPLLLLVSPQVSAGQSMEWVVLKEGIRVE